MEAVAMKFSRNLGIALLSISIIAAPTAAQTDRIEAAVSGLKWRELGPTIMGGRVADIAAVESNPSIFYVGTATAGVWKTINRGTTWTPIFEDQPVSSIGDVTLAPSNPNIVWVGTGEPQNRQSSPWGNGVYKSTDAGRTWEHMGLPETHHISRIAIHPRNPDIVYVAAVGHLWGPNPERGVFKTSDGGETWEHALFVDENTGTIDLAMDPGDPQTLFAAMYQRRRTGFGFNGGGPGSGIYRTTDGGASWKELKEGLPTVDMGRIGLDIYRRDGNLVFALVEADVRGAGFGPQAQTSGPIRNGVYRSTDRGETWEHISNTNNRPMYYSQIRVDPNDPDRIYLGGSNLFRSSDGGKTFTPDAASGVHSDHHALWIDPNNSDQLLLGGDGGISISFDKSDTWRQLRNLPLAQFYEIGVDMQDPYHVCGGLQDNGSWCAPSATLSNQGIRTRDWYNVGSGDGFFTLLDPEERIMFAESQGGNLTRVDLNTMERKRMRPIARPTDDDDDDDDDERSYRFNWDTPIVMSSHDRATIYIGGNHLMKSTDRGSTWQEISPDLTKQIDRSELEIMGVSEDRMLSRHDGTSSYGNITSVSESALDANLIYVGTDDGNLHVTRDGGATWDDVTSQVPDLPELTYVSGVVASRFDEGTAYVTFDGHRNDDFAAYAYVSENYGQSWRAITDGLPEWSVNVIAEHPRAPNLLFLGNEIGVYFSIDRGDNWVRLKNNLATVPVDDIVVHPRENDLVLGTHGRGIWIMADITPLEHLSSEVLASSAHLFPVRRATTFNPYTPQGWTPGIYAAEEPEAGALIRYYLSEDLADPAMVSAGTTENGGPNPSNGDGVESGTANVTILDPSGETIRSLEGSAKAGVQQVVWDLRIEPPYVPERGQGGGGGGGRFRGGPPRGPTVLPGTYTVRLEAAGLTLSTDVVVRGDPRIQISRADLEARQQALMSAYRLSKPVYESGRAVRRLNEQLDSVESLLGQSSDSLENLAERVDSLQSQLEKLGQDINRAGAGSRTGNSIGAWTGRPTADELWQLEQSWERLPGLMDQLNQIITVQMPALYDQLNELGIRPSVGDTITVPRRAER